MFQRTGCSSRGPGFNAQIQPNGSQLSIDSVPEDTILSSEVLGQQAHIFLSDIYADKIVIHRKEVFFKKKEKII